MAELRDIAMDQGTTFNPTFILRNPDKSPFNLSGYTARLQVRATYDSTSALLDLTSGNGKLSITAAQGRIRVVLVPGDTSALTFTGESMEGVYDLEVVSASSVVTRVAQGAFVINREVTR